MKIFEIISYIIIIIICLILAPLMTISIIFFLGGFKILGFIFLIAGVINGIRRLILILN